jgi:type VI secretion system secreted protein VgrG
VLIGGMPAARVSDLAVCVGPPDVIAMGALTTLIVGMPAARILDMTVHGGTIIMGMPTVIIGGPTSGGGGGGGAGAGGPTLNGMPIVFQADGTVQVGNGIIIKGDGAFQAKVLSDLFKIGATPTGAGLLKSIDGSGKTVTIEPTNGGNVTGYSNGADRFTKADGTPGNGTNATVGYNADSWTSSTPATQPWQTRPPAIGLAHELVHADQANHGTMSPGMTNNDNKPDPANPGGIAQEKTREVEAAGIPPNNNRPFDENKIRSEWTPQQPQRQWY